MRITFYLFSCRIFFLLLTFLFFFTQVINSQTWVRKVDGYSMWSIGKDYSGNIYAGTTGSNRGIFKSTDGGESWTNIYSTGASNYLYIACDSLNNIWVANVSNGLTYSTDGGQNFTTIPSSTFGGANVNSVACGKNGHIFVGVTNGGVWRSTDFGTTFTQSSLNSVTIVEIKVDKFNSEIIYAGGSSTSLNGFFISTDGGQTFGTSTNSVNIWEILQTSTNEIYTAATSSPYPFDKSTDGGLTWTTMSNLSSAKRGGTLDLIEDIYLSGNGGVYKSTDGGASFVNYNFTFSSNEMLTYDNKIMVCATGTTNGGVWIFTDSTIVPVELINFTGVSNGDEVKLNWQTATEMNNIGFEIQKANEELVFERIGFVPGYGTTTQSHTYSFIDSDVKSGKYSYRLKQIDYDGSFTYSELIELEVNQPITFFLDQNFPNPFNPLTTISFGIADKSNVVLTVFDVIGTEITTLVNEEKEAGKYKVSFDAKTLPSGIYFYTLKTNQFIQTRKMILLR